MIQVGINCGVKISPQAPWNLALPVLEIEVVSPVVLDVNTRKREIEQSGDLDGRKREMAFTHDCVLQ